MKIVKETEKYTTYRIYKRIFMNPSTGKIVKYHIVNLSIAKNKKWFRFDTFKNNSHNKLPFLVKEDTIISNSNNKNRTISQIYGIQQLFGRTYTRYTQAKVNKVLKEIFPKIKQKDDTVKFLYQYMFHSPVYSRFRGMESYLIRYRKQLNSSKTVKEFIHKLLGCSSKKILNQAITERGFRTVASLAPFKKHLSHGVINDCFNANFFLLSSNHAKILKKLIKKKPELVKDFATAPRWIFPDTAHLFDMCEEFIQPEDLKGGFEKIHNRLVIISKKIKVKNVECKEYFEPIRVGNIEIRCPKTTHEIIEWGDKQNHCIGTYCNSHINGDNIVAGVFQDNKLMWNLSMYNRGSKYELGQFLGVNNSSPPWQIKETVVKLMTDAEILTQKHMVRKNEGMAYI